MSDGADSHAAERSSPSMRQLGWLRRAVAAADLPDGHVVSRVAVEHRGAYELVDATGEATGALDATARRAARTPFDYPTVGDWVVRSLEARHDRRVAIADVLDRFSLLCRRAPGPRIRPQLVAANADVLAVVTTPAFADDAASPETAAAGHRIEWYLTAAFSGGARPVIVVNKIDTVSSAEHEATVDALRRRLGPAAADVPILATSALDGRGLESLGALAADGATVALSGPSGVGKSSLVNRLAGADVIPVAPLSADGRGRHTTVRRQLVPVGGPAGGTVVDTPGLQDLVPWGGDLGLRPPAGAQVGLAKTFGEIAALAHECRFADCTHTVEPGCAVAAAVEDGRLAAERLSTYLELVADMEIPDAFGSGGGSR
ncbi:ribosome small subunit-dependent GTPase A [Candidatus Poriferisodalis sp.]|uniref:ribosome small subunit-dependent GTPase A n=1 Tax=Candidatus Poriferisodalis sp. TaxID=3101277 RepID=UPI003B021EB5